MNFLEEMSNPFFSPPSLPPSLFTQDAGKARA